PGRQRHLRRPGEARAPRGVVLGHGAGAAGRDAPAGGAAEARGAHGPVGVAGARRRHARLRLRDAGLPRGQVEQVGVG
ncbi:unnamed protein product, partial [Prorocentrum cordatum]